jgi:flagellar motility protein MotE (MotC chaperone)
LFGRFVSSVQPKPVAQDQAGETAPMAQALAVEQEEPARETTGAQDAQGSQDDAVLPRGQDSQNLQSREEELRRKEQSLKELEKQIDEKLVRLQKLETNLTQLIAQAEEIKDKKLRHLIDVYSNMKAKQAATVIETLNEEIAVRILAGMRGRQAGEVLTNVKAEKAARLTERLTKMQVPFE